MRITIYGAGYVGLVTGACFAELGNHVLCVDVDLKRVELLKSGGCPIHEPGLEALMEKNRKEGRLAFSSDPKEGVLHGLYQFIAVGTPQDEDGSADLRYVLTVAESIGQYMQEYRVIIDKSTVPVGTGDKVQTKIASVLAKRGLTIDFDVVSNPEFLREGAAIDDFMQSDRIVVGASNERALNHMRHLYQPFNRNNDRLIEMDLRSAELTKYASNAMLATKISFMNELSNIADRLNADVELVRIGMGSDPRIGYHFINPGCGFGGSCFPKDLQALSVLSKEVDYDSQLINSVIEVNRLQKKVLFNKVFSYFNGNLSNKVIALWGLAFKPNTDDMREASSRDFIEALWKAGARVKAYDPVAMSVVKKIYGERNDLELVDSPEAALIGADCLAVVTEWPIFFSPDFKNIKQQLKNPVIFDGRNLYDPKQMAQMGIKYFGIGRQSRSEV